MNKNFFCSRKVYMCTFLLSLFAFCGCLQQSVGIKEFPVERTLQGSIVHDLDSLYSAYSISLSSDYYVFTQRDSFFFAVYNTSFQKVCETARKGHGSKEWMAPYVTGQQGVYGGEKYFYVLERPTHKLFMLSFRKDEQPVLVEDFKKIGERDFRYVFQTSPTTFIGSFDNETCDFFVYDKQKRSLKTKGQPELGISSFKELGHLLAQNIASYNNKTQKIAIAYFSFPLLLIRDLKGNVVKEVRFDDWPKYTSDNIYDASDYAIGITSDAENIYVLYDGAKRKEQMSILVFDWNGNPKQRLNINRSVAFAVNKQQNYIIAINEDTQKGVCTKYSFVQE